MRKLVLPIVLVLIVFLSACGNENGGYQDVSVNEAKQLIDENKVVVIDVRTQEEFQEGHIPNAKLLPLQEIEQRLEELDKDGTYLIVCRSGNRSAEASEILTNNGFANIYNMTGGMGSWTYDTEK
jgi:rhodanese-related sulfurtransferase